MTAEEIFKRISTVFPLLTRSTVPIKDYLTLRLTSPDELLPLAAWLKEQSFDMLEMVTGTDMSGPVNMDGFIRQPNFNPFLPEGASPQIESAATPGFAYRPVIDLLWSFLSVTERARVMVRLEIPREGATAPTLTGLFRSADWQERETYDLLGVRFDGHPNLTKILTPDFLAGHPLRKDYIHVKDRFDE